MRRECVGNGAMANGRLCTTGCQERELGKQDWRGLVKKEKNVTVPRVVAIRYFGKHRVEVVKLAEAKRGLVLLPRRWVVERTFG